MIEWCEIPDPDAFARRVLQAPEPVIVAFETDDCEHCRQQRSLLALAWRQLGWTAPTLRVNAARLPQAAAAYRIAGYPTIAVFDAGRLVERFPGRRDPATLTRRLTELPGVGPARTPTPPPVVDDDGPAAEQVHVPDSSEVPADCAGRTDRFLPGADPTASSAERTAV